MMHSFLLAACAALQPGAAQEPESPRSARFALASAAQSFDPLRADSTSNQVIQRQVYEGLIEYGPGGADVALVGALAESWSTSKNGRVWQFTLRADAAFYDPFEPPLWESRSRSVQAQDVVLSWARMADPQSQGRGYWAFEGLFEGLDAFRAACGGGDREAAWAKLRSEGLLGLRAVNERTIELRLTRPDPWFLNRLASPYFAVYPEEAVVRSGADFGSQPVGSGAYYLSAFEAGSSAVLKRTPDWRGPPLALAEQQAVASIEELRFRHVSDSATRSLMFEQGEIDRLPPVQDSFDRLLPDGKLSPALAEQGVTVQVVEMPDLSMLCFNMLDPEVGELPGDSAGNRQRRLLRRAIALAFPYDRWHRVLRNGQWATPARGFLPIGLPGEESMPPCKDRRHDVAAARALLEEAGWAGGRGAPTLSLELGGADPVNQAIGEMFRDGMQEIGLSVRLITNTWEELVGKMQRGEAQVFLRSWTLDWADPVNLLEVFYGPNLAPGINRCNYLSPGFDADLEALRFQPPELRTPLVARAVKRLNHDLPAIPLDHRRGYLLVQPWLKGVQVNPFDPFPCKYYWLGER